MIADSLDRPDTTPVPPETSLDRCSGIDALRSAWGARREAFVALYEEQGAISRATDDLLAEQLADTLRAPITGHVVGRFRREIDFVTCSRPRAAEGEGLFEKPDAAQHPSREEALLRFTAAAIQGLSAKHSSMPLHEIGRMAVCIAQDAAKALNMGGSA